MTLPNFIIIGAYKSGTTSLHHYLSQHPEIYMSRLKEPNFFAHEKKAEMMRQSGKEPKVIDNMDSYRHLFADVHDEKAIGESSPIYLGTPVAAERIKTTIPDVKLIAILRRPAEAFFSDHNMRIRDRRKMEKDFQGRLEELRNRVQAGQTAGPMYYAQLKTYYDLFDPQQIRVYLHEDLIQNSKKVLQDIFQFLGVNDSFYPDVTQKHNVGGIPRFYGLNEFLTKQLKKRYVKKLPIIRNMLKRVQKANLLQVDPLSPESKKQLIDLYREDIKNLEKLLGRDLNEWLR